MHQHLVLLQNFSTPRNYGRTERKVSQNCWHNSSVLFGVAPPVPITDIWPIPRWKSSAGHKMKKASEIKTEFFNHSHFSGIRNAKGHWLSNKMQSQIFRTP